jgi:hypothetical protein
MRPPDLLDAIVRAEGVPARPQKRNTIAWAIATAIRAASGDVSV